MFLVEQRRARRGGGEQGPQHDGGQNGEHGTQVGGGQHGTQDLIRIRGLSFEHPLSKQMRPELGISN
ncbi:hypothetical protein Ocin01_10844 [Orchesella cincta]|uniref:Uncharacterized protein n=1 Tax=Orchesella cincta TaxID=48709 RepID=A0A1D2MS40_ORCCI|nr:hypothetical protein Ocin01_10844 [Orchesella cincta]